MTPLLPVQSSMVQAIGYSNVDRVLAVHYAGGSRVHHYRDVPHEVAAQVTGAPSIGKAINAHIRGKFDYTTVPVDDGAPPADNVPDAEQVEHADASA